MEMFELCQMLKKLLKNLKMKYFLKVMKKVLLMCLQLPEITILILPKKDLELKLIKIKQMVKFKQDFSQNLFTV